MKTILLLSCLLIGGFLFAQNDVEESMDNLPIIENSSSVVTYKLRGVYQIKPSDCDGASFQSMRFPGGTDVYIKQLKEKLQQNVNWNSYVINGMFFIKLSMDKNGNVIGVEAGPKVANSDALLRDLKSAAQKVTGKWLPATCHHQPIESRAIVKLDFSSMTYDNSFN